MNCLEKNFGHGLYSQVKVLLHSFLLCRSALAFFKLVMLREMETAHQNIEFVRHMSAFVIVRFGTDARLRKRKCGSRNSGASRHLQKSDLRDKTNPTINKAFLLIQ